MVTLRADGAAGSAIALLRLAASVRFRASGAGRLAPGHVPQIETSALSSRDLATYASVFAEHAVQDRVPILLGHVGSQLEVSDPGQFLQDGASVVVVAGQPPVEAARFSVRVADLPQGAQHVEL